MAPAEEVRAIRTAVAVGRLDHVRYVRLRGPGAYEALDRLCPSDLYLRDGQMLHTLLLAPDAHPAADLYVCCDDEEFFLLVEGLPGEALADHLSRHLPADADCEIDDCAASHTIVALDGPYAWELLGATVGAEVVGLPYLTFFHLDSWICYRAGKTGEYGYGLIVPRDDAGDLLARLHEAGAPLDVAPAGLAALDHCALENWFFNIRREGGEPVSPIELQLQWRVSYRKSYVGSEALARRRREGPRERLTYLVGRGPFTIGDVVELERTPVGRVVNTGPSDALGEWVALALIDVAWAHPGITQFRVRHAGRPLAARSLSPPLLNNRSLHVSPQVHSYRTRHECAFPPLARG